jgi:hypothetical protein
MRKRILPILVLSAALSFSTVARADEFGQEVAGPIFLLAAIVVSPVAVPYLIVKEVMLKPAVNAISPEHDNASTKETGHDDEH